MKQTKKIFIRCPYENVISECKECRNYQRCFARKQKIIRQRRRRYIAKAAVAIVLLFCLMVIIHQICLSIISGYDSSETTEATETGETTAPTTLEPKPVNKPEISAYQPGDDYYYEISEQDKILMAKVVWAESRGECFEGKVAVAAVILNRYFNGEGQAFDRRSIESVVTQKSQFARISGVTMEDLEKYPECMQAVEAACKGWDPTRKMFSKGAFFFYAPKGVSGYQAEIRKGIKVLVIGNHNFHADFEKVS